jgi:ATP-dependent helicase/nuclease subunit B
MELFDSLTPQTTLLTPNRRLSAAFLKLHHQYQIRSGKLCWPTLDILPFPRWVQRIWENYIDKEIGVTPVLLTPEQEQLIWEEIVSQSEAGKVLLQVSSTAELAKSAWGILRQWQVELTNHALTTTEDSLIFLGWAQRFQELCEKNNWLAANNLAYAVTEKINAGLIALPEKIILKGFTEISPLYQELITACANAGTEVHHSEPEANENAVFRIALLDEETEIRTIARWAKTLWEKDATQKTGCVFPRLEDLRAKVIKIFSEVFAEAGTYCLNYTRYPFNISAGKNLSGYPVIHTALQLLNLPKKNLPLATWTALLLSPFIGAAESEMLARAQFDIELRRANVTAISIRQLLAASNKLNMTTSCPVFAAHCSDYLALGIDKKSALFPSLWVDIFMRQLDAFNWPGERSLNSHEYQIVDSWLKLLKEFSACDAVLGALSYSQAIHYLTYLTVKKIFQPESPDAPIQILGMLEATEHPFDQLWVMGMDDNAWPPPPKPNPFLPQRLQKVMQMPHATAERELLYCQQLTAQLQRGAATVIFSYAQQNAETELRPSPLITDFPEINVDELALADFISPAQQVYADKKLESISDEIAPRISPEEVIRGGSHIFKLQAACPFKAFAEIRLHAKKIDLPTPGLPAHERGVLVHKAMEIIWNELGDLETLIEYDASRLQELIEQSSEAAIKQLNSSALVPVRYRALESMRLQKIIAEWLEHEKRRPYFKVVATELECEASFANIPIVLRIDRIDELAEGKKVIIDYKTGKTLQLKYWFGARPEEPQLPLYCVLNPDNVIGLLFARLNPEDMGFVGMGAVNLGIKSTKALADVKETIAPDWPSQVAQWQKTLTQLSDDFNNGIDSVDPKHILETCKNCHLPMLCRVNESGQYFEYDENL